MPRTDASLPEYDRGAHPEGLLTRRQLRDEGLSPGGHDPVGILRCKACAYRPQWSCVHPTRAWLWRRDLARPKRTPTLAQEWALDRAMAARQTCPRCGRRYYFCLPLRTQGCCDPCHKGYEPNPDTYIITPPAKHLRVGPAHASTRRTPRMTPLTSPPSAIDQNLDSACASVVSQIGRTDGKASLLLAFNGAVLAGLASVADKDLPPATKVFGSLAVLTLGAAAVLLLLVVRPRLRGDDQASFPHWARLDEDEIRACMDGDTRAAQVRVLSILAVTKFTQLQRAVDLSLAALALLGLAAAGLAL